MIEETLINYGVLGIWTLSLLIDRYKTQKQITTVIENNTKTLTLVHEHIHEEENNAG